MKEECENASARRVGEVCTAATVALAHAYRPIEYGYNGYFLAVPLSDDFDYETLATCISMSLDQDLPNLTVDTLRLVDRILAAYEAVMVDGTVLHAALEVDDDTRSRWSVEASLDLRSSRILREVERQLHVHGDVTAAEAALDYVAGLHGTPRSLLRVIYG